MGGRICKGLGRELGQGLMRRRLKTNREARGVGVWMDTF